MSAARLADEFGVTRRTIERDIAALHAAGVPLYAERGRTGGQVSLDRGGNVVVTLSPAEVTALLLALKAAGPDMPYADAGSTAAARLLDGLPDATRVAVEHLRNRMRDRISTAATTSRRVRRTVETAVQRQVVVNISYQDADGDKTQRPVEAIGFYHGAESWFLIGWCRLRDGGRTFRLDRIERANLTTLPNADRDLDETLGWVPDEVAAL